MSVPLFNGHEPVVDAIVARLQADLTTAIAQINAADTKGVVLDDVPDAQILDYVPTPTLLVNFPTIGVQDGLDELHDDTGTGGTGHYNFTVCCFVVDADQRRLAIKLRRYARAIKSVILQGRSLDPAWGLLDGGILPGPTLGRGENPQDWMSYVGYAFSARAEEDPL
jgi:hypothetical protein